MAGNNIITNLPLPYPFDGHITNAPSLSAPSILGEEGDRPHEASDGEPGETGELGRSGELAAAEVVTKIDNLFTQAFGDTIMDKIPGTIYLEAMKGDVEATSPVLSVQGPDYPMPTFQSYKARWVIVVPVRERWGRIRFPLIHTVVDQKKLHLGCHLFESSWYGNGTIIDILLVTDLYVVFNAEFFNIGYYHAPYRVTFIARNKDFNLTMGRKWWKAIQETKQAVWPWAKPELEVVRTDVEDAIQGALMRYRDYFGRYLYSLLTPLA